MRVFVWNKPYEITIHRKSKSVCVATGEYMGERVTVQDRTPGAAAKRWAEAQKLPKNCLVARSGAVISRAK